MKAGTVSAKFSDEPASKRTIMDWIRLLEPGGKSLDFPPHIRRESIRVACRRLGIRYDTELLVDGTIRVTRTR